MKTQRARSLCLLAALSSALLFGACDGIDATTGTPAPSSAGAPPTSNAPKPGGSDATQRPATDASTAPAQAATSAPAEDTKPPAQRDVDALSPDEIDAQLGDATPSAVIADMGDMGLGAHREREGGVVVYELTNNDAYAVLEAPWEDWMGQSEPDFELAMRITRFTWLSAKACGEKRPPRGVNVGAQRRAVLDAYRCVDDGSGQLYGLSDVESGRSDAEDPLVGGFVLPRGRISGPEGVDFDSCILLRCQSAPGGDDDAYGYRYAAYFLRDDAVIAVEVGMSDGT